MFGSIGMPELIVILVIALIIFGPRKLPELGRSLGKSLGEFKKASNELQRTLEEEIRIEETTNKRGRIPPSPQLSRSRRSPLRQRLRCIPRRTCPPRRLRPTRSAAIPAPRRSQAVPDGSRAVSEQDGASRES